MELDEILLAGGMMNTPVLSEKTVYRKISQTSSSVHALLNHLRNKNITWVPQFLGIDNENREMLSFIEGDVPHTMPEWIYEDNVLCEVATRMREFHDATVDFNFSGLGWALPCSEPVEAICHNDFAPYNCVFKNGKFSGLIDFDLCSPGSRLWDISYCVYRFVPFMPDVKEVQTDENCPFDKEMMFMRTEMFLKSYAGNDNSLHYSINKLCETLEMRLTAISTWTEDFAGKTGNEVLLRNADMYRRHATWTKHIQL